ncbi:MAG: zf-HC2 domain-containing protein [bacterium]|nr:zf-HC2 domain-containing protein [bacterium]
MTHDVLRERLPAYVTGRLCPEDVEVIRRHLASGCAECLRLAFGRSGRVAAAAGGSSTRLRRAAAGAAVLAALGGGAWAVRHAGEAAQEERARFDALVVRLVRVEAELAGTRADAAATRVQHAALAARAAQLEAELLAGRTRPTEATAAPPRARSEALPGDRIATEAGRALAAPDARIAALEPVPPYRDVRGHGVWRVGGDRLLVFALALPPLPDGEGYRVELRDEAGQTRASVPLVRGAGGQARVTVPLNGDPARLSVQVVRDRMGAPVLAGRLGPRAR